MAGFDLDLVRHTLDVARKGGFVEVELEEDGNVFHAKLGPRKRKPKQASGAAEPDPNVAAKSAFVGYFRGGPNQVSVGDQVAKGDVIGTVVSLGLANSVEAPESGQIVEILVEDGAPVEYGQAIAMIAKGSG